MSKQKIVSIEIELKDYEPIKFTMAEAKELYEQLDALFGVKKTEHIHHYDRWWTRPYYNWSNGSIPCSGTTLLANDVIGKSVRSANTNMKVSYQGG